MPRSASATTSPGSLMSFFITAPDVGRPSDEGARWREARRVHAACTSSAGVRGNGRYAPDGPRGPTSGPAGVWEVRVSELDCCIAGGGPAGMMLGLLLARQGVDVLVLEKHGDFLRDFRGDTVHPSTLRLLDELGLADEFLELPHQEVTQVGATTDDGTYVLADFGRLPGKFPFLAFVPQWDFLDFLADRARRYPNFHLRMNAEAVGLLRTDGQVTGLRYRTPGDGEHEVHAQLTVAADGRNSGLRGDSGLRLREFGAPMDVLWFRLSKPPAGAGPSFGGA